MGAASGTRRIWKRVIVALAVTTFLAVYFIFNPATTAYMPKCMFHMFTGYDCPGCGSQRLLYSLLHGDLAGAWHANAYLLCISPLLALMVYAAITRLRHPRLYARLNSPLMIVLISLSLVAWTICRNL